MSPTLVDFLKASAARSPGNEAIVHAQYRVTYAALWHRCQALSAFLLSRGLNRGDRVALLLENSPEYVTAFYGTLAAGGVAVALNTQAKARDLANWMQHSDARWLIANAQHPEIPALLAACNDCQIILVNPAGASATASVPALDWATVLHTEVSPSPGPAAVHAGDAAQIIYTSGTTGAPKGVTLSHGNLSANTQSILAYLKLTGADRVLNVLPFYYSYGNSVLHTHLAVGATIVLENSLTYPHKAMQTMVQERITGFSGVPSTYALLLNRVKLREFDLTHLRYLTQAGGAMSPAHIKRLREELPQARLFVMYGQTEATARIAWLPPEQLDAKLGAVGVAIPGVTMALRDEFGKPVTRGEIGEIWVRGENIMQGYWNNSELTARVLYEGWLKTGDLARQDNDGYFYIHGRSSDMIKTGAHRISPQEIEETLLELEGVVEVAVVGVPDEILGEAIKAFVVPRADHKLEPRQVQAHCHQRLALYKVPKQVEFVNELPKTASGKIKRFLLTGTTT